MFEWNVLRGVSFSFKLTCHVLDGESGLSSGIRIGLCLCVLPVTILLEWLLCTEWCKSETFSQSGISAPLAAVPTAAGQLSGDRHLRRGLPN